MTHRGPCYDTHPGDPVARPVLGAQAPIPPRATRSPGRPSGPRPRYSSGRPSRQAGPRGPGPDAFACDPSCTSSAYVFTRFVFFKVTVSASPIPLYHSAFHSSHHCSVCILIHHCIKFLGAFVFTSYRWYCVVTSSFVHSSMSPWCRMCLVQCQLTSFLS